MLIYGLLIMAVGIGLVGSVAALARWLHRRYALPYALLTVGVLTYIPALLIQVGLLRLLDSIPLGILPIGALTLGLLAGFTEETARLLGYQYLARSADTRPQALMIGLGHGSVRTVYTGLLAVGLGLSLLGYGTERPDDLGALVSGALAESLNGILPLVMHMALSWMVLHVFLRGEWGWLFGAIFFHSVCVMMAILLGPDDAWVVVGWRVIVALVSLAVITRLRE